MPSRSHVQRGLAATMVVSVLLATSCTGSTDSAGPTQGDGADDTTSTDDNGSSTIGTEPDGTNPTGTGIDTGVTGTLVVDTDTRPTSTPPAEAPAIVLPDTSDANTTDRAGLGIDVGYGAYQVGVQTISLVDESSNDRDLTVDVWFPVGTDVAPDTPLARYSITQGTQGNQGTQGTQGTQDIEIESSFARTFDPADVATNGPFPFVVYSHGPDGARFIQSSFVEALASNGYVVAAADHTGSTIADRLSGTEVDVATDAFNRVNDVERLIDAFLNPQRPETSAFVSSIRPDQIAVAGHSIGGFTAFAMASGLSNEAGEFVADERVEAVIALAPIAGPDLLSDEELLSVTIPALVVGATGDTVAPIDPNVTRPWNLSASSPSYRVDLIGAEHESFTDLCAYQASLLTRPGVPAPLAELLAEREQAGCGPDDMAPERAQAITNAFAVALLDEVFKSGAPIDPDETAEADDFMYFATR